MDELVETLTVALKHDSLAPRDLEASLDGMQFLTDQELVKAAKPASARKVTRELSAIRKKSHVRRLTKEESHRQRVLLETLDRFILIRAQALVLLKQRGCDVSGLMRV